MYYSLAMKKILILSSVLVLLLAGCTTKDQYSNNSDSNPLPTPPPMASLDQTASPETGEQIAIIETSKGTIKMKFFPDVAPETVKNFVELAKKGYYDGITFHRVIPDFMIQGGDPTGTGMGGDSYKGPNTTVNAEFSELKHLNGTVSMARKGNDVNSASSQFFIVQNSNGTPFLDGQYTIFGQVFEGLDVVDSIAKVKRDDADKPLEDVVMKKVTIENN